MPWGLVLMGCVLCFALIMIGAPAPMLIAVGMYLPFETTSAIFVGGLLKRLADRAAARRKLSGASRDLVEQRGTLLASGLIAGEAILAIMLSVGSIVAERLGYADFSFTRLVAGSGELALYREHGGWLSLVVFGVVAYVLVLEPFRRSRTA
jgi:hypothetical protein